MNFRWSSGPVSTVIVPLRAGDRYRIEIACAPFTFPGAPVQILTVEINRGVVTTLPLRPGLQKYTIDVPRGILHPNLNLIQFRYAYVKTPAETGPSTDSRPLAVMFDNVKLRRMMTDTP